MEHPTRARPARYSTRPAQILTINVHSIDDIEWEDLFASTWLSSGQAVHIKCAVRPGSRQQQQPPTTRPTTRHGRRGAGIPQATQGRFRRADVW